MKDSQSRLHTSPSPYLRTPAAPNVLCFTHVASFGLSTVSLRLTHPGIQAVAAASSLPREVPWPWAASRPMVPQHRLHAVNRRCCHTLLGAQQPHLVAAPHPPPHNPSTHPSLSARAAAAKQQQRGPASHRLASTLNPGNATAALVEEVVRGPASALIPTRVKAKGRIVAIGDLHGDWRKTIESLQTANLIYVRDDVEIVWCGGDAVVVQLGDVMDRGDYEIAIVMLLRHLDEQAQQQGGAVYMLNGNHESLNICGDFRYVTPGAFVESALYAGLSEKDLKDWDLLARVRYAVYRPGGPMALELAKNPTVLIVNDTVFAHGGLMPLHVNYGLERLNHEVSAWMRAEGTSDGGKALPPFLAMGDASSVMWNRTQSKERFPSPNERYHVCKNLQQVLSKLGAARLIVGHTPQITGANCECDGQVWRMDVGMSYGVLNRPVQVLEIYPDPDTGLDVVNVLSDPSLMMNGLQENGLHM